MTPLEKSCLAFVSHQEGGFSNDPNDRGGATNRGITLHRFRAWVDDPTATPEQLRAMPDATWAAILLTGYFNTDRCQDLPPGVALQVFDQAVNSGPRPSARLLQECLGVPVDGFVGAITIGAAATAGPGLIAALGKRQADFYRGLKDFVHFGNGWLARVARRTAAAEALAAAQPLVLQAPPLLPSPMMQPAVPVAPVAPVAAVVPPVPPVPPVPLPIPPTPVEPIIVPTVKAPPMVEVSDVVGGALKGAAAGAVLGPVGAAGGAALGLAVQLVPQLTRWLAGDGGVTVAKVINVVEQATGTANGAAQIAAVSDPVVASALGLQLAQIAADREAAHDAATNDRLVAVLGDIADARAQTIALARQGSLMAWGSPVVSTIVLVTFGTLAGVVTFHAVPEGSVQIANIMLGSLGTMTASVVSFWVGSSLGSSRKTDLLANSVPASLLPKPAVVIPAADVKVVAK